MSQPAPQAPLPPENVRWFYYTFPLEALNSPKGSKILPAQLASDVCPKGCVLPFAYQESLVLEAVHRQHPSVRACPQRGHKAPSATAYTEWNSRADQPTEPGTDCPKVCVRGALYDALLGRREMEAAYWPGSTHAIVRGTWFCNASKKAPKKEKWVPLRESLADKIEEIWASKPWVQGLSDVALTTAAGAWVVSFRGEGEVYLSAQEPSAMDRLKGFFRMKNASSLPPGAMAIRRGLDTSCPTPLGFDLDVDEYASKTPVTHLVFTVHGIGQNLPYTSTVWSDSNALRRRMFALAGKHIPADVAAAGRVEFIPINWRSAITLPSDDLVPLVSPQGAANLRSLMANTMHEVLAYMSQPQAQQMVHSLTATLNRAYAKFNYRHRSFQGKVSILGHSLGSVMCYDVLCNQPSLYANLGVPTRPAPSTSIHFPALAFPVDNLFLLGSPLTAFLSLRGCNPAAPGASPTTLGIPKDNNNSSNNSVNDNRVRREDSRTSIANARTPSTSQATAAHATATALDARAPAGPTAPHPPPHGYGGVGDGLPAVRRLWNVFHQYDPIAYRVEPLVDVAMSGTAVVEMPRVPRSAYDEALGSVSDKLSSMLHMAKSTIKVGDAAVEAEEAAAEAMDAAQQNTRSTVEEFEFATGDLPGSERRGSVPAPSLLASRATSAWRVTGGLPTAQSLGPDCASISSVQGRIDVAMPPDSSNSIVQAIRAVRAHTGYCESNSVALFLARVCYGIDPLAKTKAA